MSARRVLLLLGAAMSLLPAVVVSSAVAQPTQSEPTHYDLVPISVPAGGPRACVRQVFSINDAGDAVGTANLPAANSTWTSVEGFRWSLKTGAFTGLPFPPANPGDSGGNQSCQFAISSDDQVADINDAGAVVGDVWFGAQDNFSPTAGLWPGGGGVPTSLGLLGLGPSMTPADCDQSSSLASDAAAINNAGDTTGFSDVCKTGADHVYLLPAGETLGSGGVDLGNPYPGSNPIEQGVAINAVDQIVIEGFSSGGTPQPATLWSRTGGTKKTLPFPSDGVPDELNDSGVVVGTDNNMPVYSVNGGAEQKLPLPKGDNGGAAYGVDNAGDVVGSITFQERGFTATDAAIWPASVPPAKGPASEPVDLDQVETGPANPLAFTEATAINKLGEILAFAPNGGYDELVPCDSNVTVDQSASSARDISTASVPLTGTCRLNVKVTGNLSFTSGLTHRSFRNPTVSRFYGGTTGTSSDVCQSGCTDLTVTVTTPSTGKPVEGAEVKATAQSLPTPGIAPYPSGVNPGLGYLCLGGHLVASVANCGDGTRTVTDHTDQNGQVELRYWAPGVLTDERVPLLITATTTGTCGMGSPTCSQREGEPQPTPILTVKPNVLIGTQAKGQMAELSPREAQDLAEWTRKNGIADFGQNQAGEMLLTKALEKMLGAEAEGPVFIASLIREYNTLDKEEQGFMALVLNAFDVRERGLGITSPDASTRAVRRMSPTPGREFLLDFAADGGQFNIDPGGLTWRYGEAIDKLPIIRKQTMYLRVTEVSFCTQGEICGPGYAGGPNQTRNQGIQPYLYFQFVADRAPIGSESGRKQVFEDSFIVPYNSEAWMRTQFGG